ncbi:hypothetical protein TPA0910_60750 [Streptomyces hygroscopicus subsp. sporocinereus]|uniref:Uncharacterized protein n=1 Tax=Streptomyces hygroscopicus TaxID=1912 RepID=A0ABQ3U7R0_STRHY|nr:hypothetical protein TPA0910_60750 [Streptomyces hygroscopicus]
MSRIAYSRPRTRQFRGEIRPPLGAGGSDTPAGDAAVRVRGGGVKFPRASCAGSGLLRLTRPTTSRRRHLIRAVPS